MPLYSKKSIKHAGDSLAREPFYLKRAYPNYYFNIGEFLSRLACELDH